MLNAQWRTSCFNEYSLKMIKIYFDDTDVSASIFAQMAQKLAAAALNVLNLEGNFSLSFTFLDEAEMCALNFESRGKDTATDVLSFPTLEIKAAGVVNIAEYPPEEFEPDTGALFLGDIVICPDVAKRQAAEFGHGEEREFSYLFVHGVLHLLGFDHIKAGDKAGMREVEESILLKDNR